MPSRYSYTRSIVHATASLRVTIEAPPRPHTLNNRDFPHPLCNRAPRAVMALTGLPTANLLSAPCAAVAASDGQRRCRFGPCLNRSCARRIPPRLGGARPSAPYAPLTPHDAPRGIQRTSEAAGFTARARAAVLRRGRLTQHAGERSVARFADGRVRPHERCRQHSARHGARLSGRPHTSAPTP